MTAPRPDTWMPLYWGDYLRDTGHLTTVEHGAYLLLIGHYWSTGGPLPADTDRWAPIARMTLAAWRKIAATIAALFVRGNDGYRHKRIDAELSRSMTLTDARREAGRIGGLKRAANAKQTPSNACILPQANTQANPTPSQSQIQDSGIELDIPTPDSAINSVPTAPPQAAGSPLDLKREMWTRGRAFLAAAGVPEKRIGPVLGRWRRDHGDAAVIDALARAEAESPSEIVPFVEGCLKNGATRHAKPHADQITNPYVLAAMRLARPGGGD